MRRQVLLLRQRRSQSRHRPCRQRRNQSSRRHRSRSRHHPCCQRQPPPPGRPFLDHQTAGHACGTFANGAIRNPSGESDSGTDRVSICEIDRSSDGCQLYRSRKKNTGYQLVKEFSSQKVVRYTDRRAGANKKYYYRLRCRKTTALGVVLGGYSKVRSVKTLNMIRPKIKGSKGVTASQIPYIALKLKRYRGSKLCIYYRIGKGKYKRLKLTSSSIKKNRRNFKIQCSNVRRTYYFRVKTSIRRKGRRYYSGYSNTVKIRR